MVLKFVHGEASFKANNLCDENENLDTFFKTPQGAAAMAWIYQNVGTQEIKFSMGRKKKIIILETLLESIKTKALANNKSNDDWCIVASIDVLGLFPLNKADWS